MTTGRYDEALEVLDEAMKLAEAAEDQEREVRVAELDLLEGCPQAALDRLKPLAGAPDLDWLCATVLLSVLAQAHLESGDAAKARELADRAIEEAEAMDNRVEMLDALRVKGLALARQGLPREAALTFEEALSRARSMPMPYAEGKILRDLGTLHASEGEPEQARKQLTAALTIFRHLKAREDARQTGQRLAELNPAQNGSRKP